MINEADYKSEKELQDWVFSNISIFIPGSNLLSGFQITTVSGKNGVPDGFAFDFDNREWYLIECELLSHGVWPHIAEQITRFVVATKNPDTLRKIRDRLFEHLVEEKITDKICTALKTTLERLHQQIELFIEGVQPTLVVFIDETNRDLEDMMQALDIPTKVFRIKKFLVNNTPEYYSPDSNEPALETEPVEKGQTEEYDIIEILGGGKLESTVGRFKCYKLDEGSVIYVKKSKYYDKNDYYWYAITPQSLKYIEEYNVSYVVFVMGEFGFAKVPVAIVAEFLKNTGDTKKADGSVKHYHLLISHDPEPELYWSNDRPKFSLGEYFQPFE